MKCLQSPFDANPVILDGYRRTVHFFTKNSGGTMRGVIYHALLMYDRNRKDDAESYFNHLKCVEFPYIEKKLKEAIDRDGISDDIKKECKDAMKDIFDRIYGLEFDDIIRKPISELIDREFPELEPVPENTKTYISDSDRALRLVADINNAIKKDGDFLATTQDPEFFKKVSDWYENSKTPEIERRTGVPVYV